MAAELLVVGPITEDVVMQVDAVPSGGDAAVCGGFLRVPGGKGANPAVVAARLGARVRLLGAVGDDATGAWVLARLEEDGVDVSAVSTERDCATGVIVHLVEPGGRRRYVEQRGANAAVRLEAAHVRRLCSAGIALVSTALPSAAVAAAVTGARAAGADVFLDVAGETDTARRVLGDAHLIRGDAQEIAALTGSPVRDFATAADAARVLLSQGPRIAIVEAGDEGELVAADGTELRLPRRAVAVVDPTGAGDALIATVAACLAGGRPLEQAVRLGTLAAAHAVTHLGGRPTFADESELDCNP